MSQIRVTRDDTGQEFTNEHLAALLRSVRGVTAVLIESPPLKVYLDTRYVVSGPEPKRDLIAAPNADSQAPAGRGIYPTFSGTEPLPEPVTSFDKAVAESVRKAGREFDKLMFASNNQADVDAYVNRQAERMGHTEIHRG